MSHLNLKLVASFLIICFSLTEFLVFNEEIFLFVCFFVFFNAVSSFGGSSFNQAFQNIGEEFENSFLFTSKEAKSGISALIVRKNMALHSIDRVLVFLNVFSRIVLQKSLINVSHSFYEKTQVCLFALQAFKMSKSSVTMIDPISQVFDINGRVKLNANVSINLSCARAFLVLPNPKMNSRLADRLLAQGLLTGAGRSLI